GAPVLVTYATSLTPPPYPDLFSTTVNAFEEKNPGIKVKIQTWPGQDFYDKLRLTFTAGQMPDMADIETKYLPDYNYRKMILDLTDMAKTAGIKQQDFWPKQWAKHVMQGKLMGLPFESDPVILVYNKSLFEQAGVPLPPRKWGDPAWTWDKLVEVATKLTQGSGAQKVWGFNVSSWWVYDYPMIWSNGGTVTDPERTKSTITMPETVDAIQFRADLIHKHKVHPTPADMSEGVDPLFANGRLAMN